MSKKPYIVQRDSPNLVIVPTDTVVYDEPSQKKVKLDSDLPTPTQAYNNGVFAHKHSSKSNFHGVNNNVLIDVSKVQRSPTSWATNFMQSIGGSSTKYTKIYPSMPKSPPFPKDIQPGNSTEITLANTTTQMPNQAKTNTETPPILGEKKSAPKININLIKPKPKPAFQSTLSKETSQLNSNAKSYQLKTDTSTNQAKVHKEPSLPKNYKIPMHSKNKPVIQSVTDTVSIKENCHKSHSTISSCKSSKDVTENRLSHQQNTLNEPSHPKDPIQLKHELVKTNTPKCNREKTHASLLKTKKTKVQQINENHPTRSKYDEPINSLKNYKETEPNHLKPTRNKENSQPEYSAEIKKRNISKETTLPRQHKELSHTKSKKEITCLKTNEITAQLMNTKETSKGHNKKEPTLCTKLKTKTELVKVKSNKTSKISKHSDSNKYSEKSKLKKHKDKVMEKEDGNFSNASNLLKDKDNVTKLKKKRITEVNSTCTTEHSDSKNKKLKTSGAKTTKNVKSQPPNEDRLSKSISPIKSVVSKMNSDLQSQNSDKRYHNESSYSQNDAVARHHKELGISHNKEPGYSHSNCENKLCKDTDYHFHNSEKDHRGADIDLRAKLKRKLTKNKYLKDYVDKRSPTNKNKFATVAKGRPFVPEENLIISFDTKDDSEENVAMMKSPPKKLTRKQPSGGNKRKKIKLEINIVFGQADTTDDESIKSTDDTKDEPLENMDLSFLDNFNVDEIVESLNECDCSRKTNSVEPVVDSTIQNSQNNETQKLETMEVAHDDVLLNKNEIKVETDICKAMSSLENNVENQETMLQSTAYRLRPCHREEIHGGIYPDTSKIKEEVLKTELLENDKSHTHSSVQNLMYVQEKANIPQDDASKQHTSDNKLTINGDKRSTCSLNDFAGIVKKTPTNNDLMLVTKVDERTYETPLSSANNIKSDHKERSNTLLQGNSKIEKNNKNPTNASINNEQAVKNNLVTAEMSSTITKHSKTLDSTAGITTVSFSTQKENETSTSIKEEYDIITIDDSESENETEIEKNPLSKNTQDLPPSSLNISDDVIVIEPAHKSESILILDTDYNIEENDGIKTQSIEGDSLKSADQKKEMKIDLDDTVNKVILEEKDTPVELKTNTTEECSASEKVSLDKPVNMEITKSEIHTNQNETDHVSDEASNKKTTGMDTDVTKKSTLTKDIVNTKQQCVNKEHEKTVPNKSSPQDNSENMDSTTKANEKVNSGLANDHFVCKAETKLLIFLRQKCTVTDVIRVGKYSKIYLCRDSLKREYALKSLKTGLSRSDGLRSDLKHHSEKEKMLIKLQNGVPQNNLNCVRFIKGFVICGRWCFLMEYYPMNLQQAFAENKRSFHIDDVQVLSRQLVSAVTILRNNNIIHSDIKPSHILINAAQTRIKLCGFDQSCYIEDSVLLPNTGTVNYRAPELILGYPAGYGIDVWSTALVMYEMATNRKMFQGIYNNNILHQQLCTLGRVPMDMLMESKFNYKHFRGTAFTKVVSRNGEKIVIDEIKFNGKINATLYQTYASEWNPGRSEADKRNDKAKISAFAELLRCMLVMHPKYRIAIEFVFANPFIYESFDNDF